MTPPKTREAAEKKDIAPSLGELCKICKNRGAEYQAAITREETIREVLEFIDKYVELLKFNSTPTQDGRIVTSKEVADTIVSLVFTKKIIEKEMKK